MKITFKIDKEMVGMRLDHAVHAGVSAKGRDLSKRGAKQLIDAGAVTINGRVSRRASMPVLASIEIVVDLPPPAPTQNMVDLSDAVLYRDDYVLAINKPAWLATHATRDTARDHALAGVERILRAEGHKTVKVAVHHRLDVETSGVLIFGIHPDANKGLGSAFSDRLAQKTYIAVTVPGDVSDTWTVENYLGKDSSGKREKSVAVTSGGDHALTEFTVQQRLDDALVLEARPHTGRMHQIRAHLAASGLPIIGDSLYGGPRSWRNQKAERMLLHAWKLELPHPVTGEPLCIESELPPEFVVDTKR